MQKGKKRVLMPGRKMKGETGGRDQERSVNKCNYPLEQRARSWRENNPG